MPIAVLNSEHHIQRMQVEKNTLISELLLHKKEAPPMPCAGKGRCGKCRVIAFGELSPVTQEEKSALREEELAKGVRLACCTRIIGDVQITPYAAQSSEKILADGAMPQFSLEPLFKAYGAAIDIGTTTLAAQLYGANGLVASAAAPNPQAVYGADVISRIEQSLGGKAGELAGCIQNGISALLKDLANKASIESIQIDHVVITGNTAMLYLLTQRNPDCLAHAPFCADMLFGNFVSASSLNLPCAKGAQVYFPKCISAFVGADITTAILSSDMCSKRQTALLTDIGTNGEMALWHDGKLMCCSTAAGPAFEGAGLSMGMQGAQGAIDHVSASGGVLKVHTLGADEAKGICGSGIVDALACMTVENVLEESGYIAEDGHSYESNIKDIGGETVFMLTDSVFVSQKDVRMVQLAKSAVCAGISTLIDFSEISPSQIDRLYIAGGFGSFLDLESAAEIGLFPYCLLKNAVVLGNAALAGASMILQSRHLAEKSSALAASAQTVDLTGSPVFMEQYMDCMMFRRFT